VAVHLSTFHIYKYVCQSDVHTKTHHIKLHYKVTRGSQCGTGSSGQLSSKYGEFVLMTTPSWCMVQYETISHILDAMMLHVLLSLILAQITVTLEDMCRYK